MSGTGTGGRIVKDDVLGYVDGNGGGDGATATAAAPTPAEAEVQPIRGPDAALARYMEAEPRDPDRDQLPHAFGRDARWAAPPAERRAQGCAAGDEGVLHASDRIRDRAGLEDPPDDGPRLPARQWQAPAGHSSAREPRAGRRRAAQGRRADVDRARHQAGRHARLRGLPGGLRGPHRKDTRRQSFARRHAGRQHHAHQPRWDRHGGIGAAPDARPGDDRRDRRDHVAARARRRGSRPPRRARRLEGDDDDLDLRPSRDPGRRVGRVPAAGSRSCSSGADGFYEEVFRSFGLEPPAAPPKTAPRRRPAPLPSALPRRCSPTCRPPRR